MDILTRKRPTTTASLSNTTQANYNKLQAKVKHCITPGKDCWNVIVDGERVGSFLSYGKAARFAKGLKA
jgi:hypothetical protein